LSELGIFNMGKFVISGGSPLRGEVFISGAKNVALKTVVAALLTEEEVIIDRVPLIADLFLMVETAKRLGVKIEIDEDRRTLFIRGGTLESNKIPLEVGARIRTSSMFLSPLLSRFGEAIIPNPGGCRIGARPIDRHIEGLREMGAKIYYDPTDGYFHAEAARLHGVDFTFSKNTHTGTETLILAAVKASGRTVLENAAQEPEVDDLIRLLNLMGAKIQRVTPRKIVIEGVKKLKGTRYKIMADRNEIVTFAIGALVSKGDVIIHGGQREYLKAFLGKVDEAGGGWEPKEDTVTRFFYQKNFKPTNITTGPYPSFMTDWQAPWALLMTQAGGLSTIHETVYESRFSYVFELRKMGVKIEFFDPKVTDPQNFYNFNWADKKPNYHQGIKIFGPTSLHNAVLEITDLRAGATLVLAAILAKGESYLWGVEQIDRGYEKIEERLKKLGADIKRTED